MRVRKLPVLTTVALCCTFGVRCLGAPQYELVPLATAPGTTASSATDINDAGVIGGYRFAGQDAFAMKWVDAVGIEVGNSWVTRTTLAYAINDAGTCVGTGSDALANNHALVFASGTLTNLGRFGGENAQATGISNAGHIVGYAAYPNNVERGFLQLGTGTTLIGTFGGNRSRANAVNSGGVVVGSALRANNQSRGFRYSAGVLEELETLGGNSSSAVAISESGLIVGSSTLASGAQRAVVFENLIPKDIGLLPNRSTAAASGINERGDIVGFCSQGFLERDAFLYTDCTMYNLNDLISPGSGWRLTGAAAINAHGEIVGTATYQGIERAYLLRPIPESNLIQPVIALVATLATKGSRRRQCAGT